MAAPLIIKSSTEHNFNKSATFFRHHISMHSKKDWMHIVVDFRSYCI